MVYICFWDGRFFPSFQRFSFYKQVWHVYGISSRKSTFLIILHLAVFLKVSVNMLFVYFIARQLDLHLNFHFWHLMWCTSSYFIFYVLAGHILLLGYLKPVFPHVWIGWVYCSGIFASAFDPFMEKWYMYTYIYIYMGDAPMRDISHLLWEIMWGPSHPYPMPTT